MKILIIVLVLCAVLFVVLIVWGHGNNGNTSNAKDFKPDSYPMIGSLGSMFGPPGPTLKATDLTPNPAPLRHAHGAVPAGKFRLSAGDQPLKFNISSDSKDEFRQATFAISKQGCAAIEYTSADGSGGKLKDQKWPTDGADAKHPDQAKFQILSVGGSLAFTFHTSDCTVDLE